MISFLPKKQILPECKPEWNREAITVFSRLPSLMAADKPCPQLQPSLCGSGQSSSKSEWFAECIRLRFHECAGKLN